MRFIEEIRESWRKALDVKEADDLPYVLLTEAVNQSVLRGATRIDITYDSRTISVTDDAAPFGGRLESLLQPAVGIMNDEARHLLRLTERQWRRCPYGIISALCKSFKLVSCDGDTLRSITCEDGEVTSSSTSKVSIGSRNVVFMVPMLFADNVRPEFMENLVNHIAYLFPQVTFFFRSGIEEAEEYEDTDERKSD